MRDTRRCALCALCSLWGSHSGLRSGARPWACALCLVAWSSPAPGQTLPAGSQPASSPTTRPASSPARSQPVPPSLTIEDAADDDGWAPAPASLPIAPSSAVEPATTFSARGQLRLALDTWHESGLSEDVMELQGQLLATLHHRVSRWFALRLGARMLYRLTCRRPGDETDYLFNGALHRNDLEADLLDSNLQLRVGSWLDVTAGSVTQVWGATDLVNPNDVLAPRDLRFGLYLDPETSRLPAPMVRAEVYLPRGFGLAVYFLPLHVPDRVDLFGSDFALLGPAAPDSLRRLGQLADVMLDDSVEGVAQDGLLATRRPRPFSDPTLAARVGVSRGGWDLGLHYAWLFERQPQIRLDPGVVLTALPLFAGTADLTPEQRQQLGAALVADPAVLESTFRRQQHVGLGLSGGLWGLAVNMDIAYRSAVSVPLGGSFPLRRDPDDDDWLTTVATSQSLAWTVGLTYTRGEELLLTLEGWQVLYIDLLLDSDAPQLLLGRPQQGGLAFLGRYRLYRPVDLTFQLLVHTDLANRGIVITPQVSYHHGDHLGLVLGLNLFQGDDDSLAGRLDPNDQVFLGVEGYL